MELPFEAKVRESLAQQNERIYKLEKELHDTRKFLLDFMPVQIARIDSIVTHLKSVEDRASTTVTHTFDLDTLDPEALAKYMFEHRDVIAKIMGGTDGPA